MIAVPVSVENKIGQQPLKRRTNPNKTKEAARTANSG